MTTEPFCPQCGRSKFLVYDGDYWWACTACGARTSDPRMRRKQEKAG